MTQWLFHFETDSFYTVFRVSDIDITFEVVLCNIKTEKKYTIIVGQQNMLNWVLLATEWNSITTCMKVEYDIFSWLLLFPTDHVHVSLNPRATLSSRTFLSKYFIFNYIYMLTSERDNLSFHVNICNLKLCERSSWRWYATQPLFCQKHKVMCFFFNAGNKWYNVKYLGKNGRRMIIIISQISKN